MHEWLEALRKSAKATSEGVLAEEVRRAETECGVPFPADLANLYQTLNGGEFQGDVRLYPLRGEEGAPSVLEKSRLSLVGLPVAGVWRFGLKGPHRHLFVARKSAMEEQGDGGGALPGWMETLDSDDWVFGTWESEKREMRLYRTLKDMLEVLVPPVEVESFGERTFARAMNAVLQGALSGAEVETGAEDEDSRRTAFEGETEAPPTDARDRDYSRDLAALAQDADEDSERESDEEAGEEGAQEELFEAPESSRPETEPARAPAAKKGRATLAIVPPADEATSAPARGSARKAATKSALATEPARKSATKPEPTRKSAGARKATGKATSAARAPAPTSGGARKAAAKKAAPTRGGPAKKAAAKKTAVPSRGAAKKAAAKKGAVAKKGAAARKGATAKKGVASKRGTAKKAAAPKRSASTAKKTGARKGAAKTAPRGPAAKKKSARRRS